MIPLYRPKFSIDNFFRSTMVFKNLTDNFTRLSINRHEPSLTADDVLNKIHMTKHNFFFFFWFHNLKVKLTYNPLNAGIFTNPIFVKSFIIFIIPEVLESKPRLSFPSFQNTKEGRRIRMKCWWWCAQQNLAICQMSKFYFCKQFLERITEQFRRTRVSFTSI